MARHSEWRAVRGDMRVANRVSAPRRPAVHRAPGGSSPSAQETLAAANKPAAVCGKRRCGAVQHVLQPASLLCQQHQPVAAAPPSSRQSLTTRSPQCSWGFEPSSRTFVARGHRDAGTLLGSVQPHFLATAPPLPRVCAAAGQACPWVRWLCIYHPGKPPPGRDTAGQAPTRVALAARLALLAILVRPQPRLFPLDPLCGCPCCPAHFVDLPCGSCALPCRCAASAAGWIAAASGASSAAVLAHNSSLPTNTKHSPVRRGRRWCLFRRRCQPAGLSGQPLCRTSRLLVELGAAEMRALCALDTRQAPEFTLLLGNQPPLTTPSPRTAAPSARPDI